MQQEPDPTLQSSHTCSGLITSPLTFPLSASSPAREGADLFQKSPYDCRTRESSTAGGAVKIHLDLCQYQDAKSIQCLNPKRQRSDLVGEHANADASCLRKGGLEVTGYFTQSRAHFPCNPSPPHSSEQAPVPLVTHLKPGPH